MGPVAEPNPADDAFGPCESAVADDWPGSDPRSRLRKTWSLFAPVDHASRSGPVFQQTLRGGLNSGIPHQLHQDAAHHLFIEQALTVLGERVGVPDRMVWDQAHKAAEQQVVVELLQKQLLRAAPVERLGRRSQ